MRCPLFSANSPRDAERAESLAPLNAARRMIAEAAGIYAWLPLGLRVLQSGADRAREMTVRCDRNVDADSSACGFVAGNCRYEPMVRKCANQGPHERELLYARPTRT